MIAAKGKGIQSLLFGSKELGLAFAGDFPNVRLSVNKGARKCDKRGEW